MEMVRISSYRPTFPMSHIVNLKTRVTDNPSIAAACQRLSLAPPTQGTAHLFSGEAKGTIVQLPGWQYPVAIDTATGDIHFDNYEGAWGAQAELDKFLQAYAIERCRLEARKKGLAVSEQALTDGSIKLRIQENT